MRIAIAADELTGVAGALAGELERRGHATSPHGALAPGERPDWAWASAAAAREVAEGRAAQAVVCCWTGTGASIAANKVPGIRAALCLDAATAAGARRWNDANVLALSLRATSQALLEEILDAWLAAGASEEPDDRANVAHLDEIGGAEVTPELAVRAGRAAIDFYKRAFGAVEAHRAGGSDEHPAVVARLCVQGASFWVADESPEHHGRSPEALGATTARLLLRVADPDAVFARALAAGARELAPVAEEHGWRVGKLVDPFGHQWEVGRPLAPWPPRRG